MIAIITPTLYLPPIDAVALIKVSGKAIVDIHETYPRQTYRNRCRIGATNGILDLSIPVEKPLGNHTPTAMIAPSIKLQWQKQHWRSIMSAYGNSSFFMYYSHLFEPFFLGKVPETLVQWNENLQKAIFDEMGFKVETEKSSSFQKDAVGKLDLRNIISPKAKNQDAEKNQLFKPYYQPFSHKYGFVPNLSIIDALFNLGPDTTEYLDECGKKLISYYSGMQYESGTY